MDAFMMEKVDEEQFSRNLQLWGSYCPSGARKVLSLKCTHVNFCTTNPGEFNLRKGELFFHSQEGAFEEAKKWFESLDLYNISTLIVFGVGLGYYYQAAKDWLLEDSGRFIIFVEDDLEVIHHLFETELGSEMIFDNQVWLQYFQSEEEAEGEERDYGLSSIPQVLLLGDIQISALKSYGETRQSYYGSLKNYLQYLKDIKVWHVMEHVQLGRGFFRNFYHNLINIPKAYLSDKMFGQFKDVPAIICGAGPSLEKNRHLLEQFKDRAVIFAGGSSMNVLNETGFLPHFGVGIDPNAAQFTRIFMNHAFQVPYFYRLRMHSEALETVKGAHILVRGVGGYDVTSWFEEKFNIEGKTLSEGNNVVNFSLAIAHALGCNPIIFVGLDLAYTDKEAYAKGVHGHPLFDMQERVSTKAPSDELLLRNDIYGNQTFTLWKWVMESMWYSEYALTHPDLQLINATEGGIGCEGIVNMSLQEVADTYLGERYDLDGRVHGVIEGSPMPANITDESILRAIGEFEESISRCLEFCHTLRREFNQLLKGVKGGEEVPPNLITDKAFEALQKLNQEDAYTYLLNRFNDSFLQFAGKSLTEHYEGEVTEGDLKIVQARKVNLNKRRYEFLKAVCAYNKAQIKTFLHQHAIREALAESSTAGLEPLPIEIPDLLDVAGEEKRESEHSVEFFKKGKLHGPSTFFGPGGQVLSKSVYRNGSKEGPALTYYDSGEVHSVQTFKKGQFEGKQTYYYRNGIPKAYLNYKKEKLDGHIRIFHPTGITNRSIYFKEGKRHGIERLWNIGRFLEYEAEFSEGRPIGEARAWYPNGQIAREVIYDNESKPCSVRQWTSDGVIVPKESLVREDYFDVISKQTSVLTESLESIFEHINEFVPESSEISEIKSKVESLRKMEEKMHAEMGEKEGDKEAIWKTPTARRLMGKQLEAATKKMAEDIATIEEALKLTGEILKKKPKDD